MPPKLQTPFFSVCSLPAMSTADTGQEWLTEDEAAVYVGKVPKATLKQWRWLRQGPPYSKVGRRVVYRRTDLDRWIEANRIEPQAS
jgi:hypothetical protein